MFYCFLNQFVNKFYLVFYYPAISILNQGKFKLGEGA